MTNVHWHPVRARATANAQLLTTIFDNLIRRKSRWKIRRHAIMLKWVTHIPQRKLPYKATAKRVRRAQFLIKKARIFRDKMRKTEVKIMPYFCLFFAFFVAKNIGA
jgi:hypothetical protein